MVKSNHILGYSLTGIYADSENINGTDTVQFYGDPWFWGDDGASHGTHVVGIIVIDSVDSDASFC
jgi:hypothetical protein